ncbi:uncharacterized protein LOC116436072 [Corvus moneduloides]|uniref:uncharacterized protein LOC116436072 n=1 Tax=Corvus moneduloides TaxID=1196302 RepID=UPI0013643706|nr:uncharacterized protein LOC116436072 [Corvus moneduloides]
MCKEMNKQQRQHQRAAAEPRPSRSRLPAPSPRRSSARGRQGRWWLPAGQGGGADCPAPAGGAVARARPPLHTAMAAEAAAEGEKGLSLTHSLGWPGSAALGKLNGLQQEPRSSRLERQRNIWKHFRKAAPSACVGQSPPCGRLFILRPPVEKGIGVRPVARTFPTAGIRAGRGDTVQRAEAVSRDRCPAMKGTSPAKASSTAGYLSVKPYRILVKRYQSYNLWGKSP